MKNPWTSRNPFLSLWLSGANAVAGSVRARAIAESRRQAALLSAQGMRQITDFWTGAWLAPPPKKKKRRRPG